MWKKSSVEQNSLAKRGTEPFVLMQNCSADFVSAMILSSSVFLDENRRKNSVRKPSLSGQSTAIPSSFCPVVIWRMRVRWHERRAEIFYDPSDGKYVKVSSSNNTHYIISLSFHLVVTLCKHSFSLVLCNLVWRSQREGTEQSRAEKKENFCCFSGGDGGTPTTASSTTRQIAH